MSLHRDRLRLADLRGAAPAALSATDYARIPDEVWLPALAKAEMEGRNASEAMTEALRKYASEPRAAAYEFTFANWPEARQWTDGHSGALAELAGEVEATISGLSVEWLSVAAWLASTRHPANPVQQRRVLAGHVIGRAIDMPGDSAWRARYRDTRHLLETSRRSSIGAYRWA